MVGHDPSNDPQDADMARMLQPVCTHVSMVAQSAPSQKFFSLFFHGQEQALIFKGPAKKNLNMTVCRHCSKLSFDDKSYASVLVVGSIEGLEKTIEDLESRIMPCVSALCPRCEKISVLSNGTTESLLCTVFMWQRLREWIDTSYDEKHARIPPHSGV